MGIMNHVESTKGTPDELAAAIEEWWRALAAGIRCITASQKRRNPSPDISALVPVKDAVLWGCLESLLVIGGAVAIVVRLPEIADWPWLLVNIVLKITNWL
jgi:hypothetical protein